VILPVTDGVGDRVVDGVGELVSDAEVEGDGLGDGDALGLATAYTVKSSEHTNNVRSRPIAAVDWVMMGTVHRTAPVPPSKATNGPY
jgi:hypothetical protein